ncbi:NAD(P)/FAD-dependent oxidoreductase [Saccharothrix australiensis]|uniref:2-polyprenyl-6-methoxyphenol hydroxylase-like FAD-dependent oxidoreductase n=1 Tax=Saccharothrix australiensis TaxID=2072 RepID=A0A495VZT9_9PSEU|nr:FAD-dependent oxidoreductase [Saccharothrix australiensis]RKT54664.1 2-polyprenyl-6-methoxyphenol hydroxylase-like FAD-dependent oxidoreductase [Saccharothrix australiensis]
MYDVIVVGARCAGAATALLLARRGHRVLLLDRARFPADTMSTLYIHQPGVARLARWGVLDAVVASGCPPLDTVHHHVADVRLSSPAPAADGASCGYAPRRRVLDAILVDAAVAAGAEFADGCRVRELRERGGRVTGVGYGTPGGGHAVADARLVVGADGMNSAVAGLAGAAVVAEHPKLSCVYYSAWTGVTGGFGFHERTGNWVARIPTHDGVTLVATYFPQDRFDEVRANALDAHLAAVAATAPELRDQLAYAERVDRLRGTGDQRNFFRAAAGPGWALVGDAGHHRDTITAQGITNALAQAELLADAIGDEVGDPGRLDAALRAFGRARDDALADGYRSTLELARLRVPPERLEFLRAISGTPALVERYFALTAGLLDSEEFLTPEVVALL